MDSQLDQLAGHIAALTNYGFRFGTRADFDLLSGQRDRPGIAGTPGKWGVWDDAPGMGGDYDSAAMVGDNPLELAADMLDLIRPDDAPHQTT